MQQSRWRIHLNTQVEGITIGRRTYGAGYLGDDYSIHDKYVLWISNATGKHPNALRNWEGKWSTTDDRYGL